MTIMNNIATQIRTETAQLDSVENGTQPLRIRLLTGAFSLVILAYVGMFEAAALILALGAMAELLFWVLHRRYASQYLTLPLWKILLVWLISFLIMAIYMAPAITFSRHTEIAVITLSVMWVCGTFIYIANTYARLPLLAFFKLVPVITSGFVVITLITQPSFDTSSYREWFLMALGLCIFGALVVENVIRQKRANNALESALAVTKQQFQELKSVKQQLADAVEGLDSGFALYDKDQQLVMHNSRFVAMHPGLSDLIKPGIHYDALMSAMVKRRLLLAPEKAVPLLEKASDLESIELTLANGALYNIRFNTTAHGDQVSLVTDITEAVQGQQKLRAMFDVSADAMFDCDLINRTVTFDTGFKTQFGHDWIGRHPLPSVWETTLHPDDQARIKQDTAQFIHSREVRLDIEFRMQRSDGSWAYVAQRTVALRDDNGKAISMIGAVADLTEKRHLEEQLLAAQKMEAMGRISGGIAHDFNNLLAVIMGNAEQLKGVDIPPNANESVREIFNATKRGAELTRRLLTFARRSRLAPERIAPNEMMSGMEQIFSRVLPATISVNSAFQDDVWHIKLDPAFLENSLLNLVINARDAMPEGGILTIETANQHITEDYALSGKEPLPPGRYVMIAVSDTGHGIPANILERVVEPFFTTKPPNQGSGMGLSMVDGFVRQSGGLMRIYSEVDVGTTVRFLLPADPDENGQPDEHPVVDPTLTLNTRLRILLVEDNPNVRAVLARMLEDTGLEIIQAESGDEALERYNSLPKRPDVLLTDVVMPGNLQGPELAQQLREQHPDLQIILMSGYASEAAINGNGLRADDRFLMKPIQRSDLLGLLAAMQPLDDG